MVDVIFPFFFYSSVGGHCYLLLFTWDYLDDDHNVVRDTHCDVMLMMNRSLLMCTYSAVPVVMDLFLVLSQVVSVDHELQVDLVVTE